jgi:heme/copper-type cytochrome/quinol oxidase subunit 3
MKSNYKVQTYPFLLDPSPWPFLMSFAALFVTTGMVLVMHAYVSGKQLLIYGFFMVLLIMFLWLRDVVRESTLLAKQTSLIRSNLRIGFVLFIVSEVMFFFAFFWAYFHSSLSPVIQIGSAWPPVGIEVFRAWDVPLLNTAILLISGASVTWVQYAIIAGLYDEVIIGFVATLFLSFLFLFFQFKEYVSAAYGISDGIYGSVFYLLTGFHGFHVMIGTIFLFVCFIRFLLGHFNPKSYSGFAFAAWYWHFVDVVWLFLFVSVYIWGSTGI